MRANVEAHCRERAVNIEQRSPQIVERDAVTLRKDHVGALVALPNFGIGLPEDDVRDDVERERQDGEANCSRHAEISRPSFSTTPYCSPSLRPHPHTPRRPSAGTSPTSVPCPAPCR